MLACVVFSVLRGGWRSGVASGVVSIASYAWLSSRGTWRFHSADLQRLGVELGVMIPLVFALGRLVTNLDRVGRAERRLRQEAEAAGARFAEILERITDGFIALDRDWRCVFINARAKKLLGCSSAEFIGVPLWQALPPLVGSAWDREYRRAMASGEAVHFEEYYPILDTWFESHAYPSANGLSIYLRDVSERIRAEQALKRRVLQQAAIAHVGQLALAGASFQAVLDEAVARIGKVFDVELVRVLERQPDGRLLLRAGIGWQPGLVGSALFEPATESQAGYTLLCGAPVIVEDLRSERRFRGLQLLVEHGAVSGMSLVIPARGAPYGILAVHSRTRRDFTSDDVTFLTGMAQVLGIALEWNHSTGELRQSEQRFRQLADNLREVLFVTDADHRDPGYVSPMYEQVWGRPVESWYTDPLSWLEAVHPEDRQRVEAALTGLERGQFDQQLRIVRRDGSVRWIHDRAFGVNDSQGRLQRIVGIAEDVTEARQLAEEHAARAAAEARATARDEVLAMVSHDMRNPLSRVELAASVLDMLIAAPQPSRQVQVIRRAVAEMKRLTCDLLDTARADAGMPLNIEQRDIDPSAVLEGVLETYAVPSGENPISIEVSPRPNLPHVFADLDRLLQALGNLLSNALKFTPPGGHIWVTADAAGSCVRFSVLDSGSGIAPEHASRLFERYWQARRDRRGIGLGLPIVKGIAEAHGGRVWAEPRPGGGAAFHLEIPVLEEQAEIATPSSSGH